MHTTPPEPARIARAVIVHGYAADPRRHWFPWLTDELASRGVEVRAVALPDPAAPNPRAWQDAVAKVLAAPDDHTWVIAHSLGVVTALRHLANLPLPWSLGGLVAVSGFTCPLPGLPELDGFVSAAVDFGPIVANVACRIVVRSDDDTTVPSSATDALAKRLRTDPVVVPGAGHFLDEEGILDLPFLIPLLFPPVKGPVAPIVRPRIP